MAARNDEAIQMAVDYLLSADGASPIEVQLSFLKSRMKMSHTDITEALRLTGLKPSSTAAGPTAQQSVVQQAGHAATAPETAPDRCSRPRAGQRRGSLGHKVPCIKTRCTAKRSP